jgi:hypothetical protein
MGIANWTRARTIVLLAAAFAACREAPTSEYDDDKEGASFDRAIHDFLPDYVERHPMFLDDELEYWVKDGRVTARGSLDSDAEREELDRRIRRIPAVRDVDLSGVTVG